MLRLTLKLYLYINKVDVIISLEKNQNYAHLNCTYSVLVQQDVLSHDVRHMIYIHMQIFDVFNSWCTPHSVHFALRSSRTPFISHSVHFALRLFRLLFALSPFFLFCHTTSPNSQSCI